MTCSEESFTGADHGVRADLRLERIAAEWEDLCAEKYNSWAKEYNRRIDEMNAQQDADHAVRVKVHHWRQELNTIFEDLNQLVQKFGQGEDIRPEHWDAVVSGNERTVLALISKVIPRETWPRGVPYPNLIAKALYDEIDQERCRVCTTKYHEVVKEIAERGKKALDLKRIAGDTTDGIRRAIPNTMHEWQSRQVLLAKYQFSQPGWKKIEENKNEVIAIAPEGERVHSDRWDPYAGATSPLTHWDLIVSDLTKDHIVQSADEMVERSHLDRNHEVGADDNVRVASVECGGTNFHPSSDDELEIDHIGNINFDDELFLPYDY